MVSSKSERKYENEVDLSKEYNQDLLLMQVMEQKEALKAHVTLLIGSCDALEQKVLQLENDKLYLEQERKILLEETTWTRDSVVKGLLQEWDARERGFKAAMEQKVGEWRGKERAMQREITSLQGKVKTLEKAAASKLEDDSDCARRPREGKASRLKDSLAEMGLINIVTPDPTLSNLVRRSQRSQNTASCVSDSAHCRSRIVSLPKLKRQNSLPKSFLQIGKRGAFSKHSLSDGSTTCSKHHRPDVSTTSSKRHVPDGSTSSKHHVPDSPTISHKHHLADGSTTQLTYGSAPSKSNASCPSLKKTKGIFARPIFESCGNVSISNERHLESLSRESTDSLLVDKKTGKCHDSAISLRQESCDGSPSRKRVALNQGRDFVREQLNGEGPQFKNSTVLFADNDLEQAQIAAIADNLPKLIRHLDLLAHS